MSNLVIHAQNEMQKAGLYNEDSDYNGMVGHAVEELVRKLAEQGHSGSSAAIVLAVFDKVARFDVLTPITTDSEEWHDVSEMAGRSLWQNRRKPSVFSEDGGQTWYDLENVNEE